jgi:tetratricopeptide (TPR) repeat protein
MHSKKRKILLIGWDAADWKVINPLIEAGEMPALEGLINEGVMGNLATLEPSFSPMLWTSIATGKRAHKHGVLGFIEPDSSGLKVRPVSVVSRKVKAIWNILMQEGMRVHNVGWWPSHPAEPLNGISISNYYQKAMKPLGQPWPLSKGTVHPGKMIRHFARLRVHPGELTPAHILPFVPRAAEVDQDNDKRLISIAKMLAENASVNSAATWILENQEWDFMGVYFDGIDHFSHGFMNFHPPRMRNVTEEQFELYKDAVKGIYKFHDMMLERQLKLAGPDATVILVSDHGFHSDHLRPIFLGDEPAAPAQQHRAYGVICMKGPGIKKDERIYGATLLDVAPTILSLLGLPVGGDMDGKPLVQAFEDQVEVKRIESWESVDGDCGMHPADRLEDPIDASEEIARLVELGYIEEPKEDDKQNVEKAVLESRYNLGRAYIGAGMYSKADPIFEELVKNNPEQSRFVLRLASCKFELREYERCMEIATTFGEWLSNELAKRKDKKPEEIDREQIDDEELKRLEEEQRKDKLRLLNTRKDLMSLEIIRANVHLKQNEADSSIEIFRKLLKSSPGSKQLHLSMGSALVNLRKWAEAKKSFETAVSIDSDDSSGYHGIAVCQLRLGNNYEAIDAALESIALMYHFPFAHYHLGEALFNIEEYERAAEAFEVCLAMNPSIGKARNMVAEIYEEKLGLHEKAQSHKDYFLEENSQKGGNQSRINGGEESADVKNLELQDPVIVVSGLPRSGTSMMMQMLEKGGVDLFTDQERKADESNPKGYLEHKAVKSLARDARWVKDAKNKAVKIIANLLFFLPDRNNYKVIFMLRHIDEVINSQQQMLIMKKREGAKNYPVTLAESYRKTLEKARSWGKRRHNVDIIYVNYSDVVEDPRKEAMRVAEFLGGKIDIEQMTGAVDGSLYRTKIIFPDKGI